MVQTQVSGTWYRHRSVEHGTDTVCVRCPTGGLQEVVVCYRSSMCLCTMPYWRPSRGGCVLQEQYVFVYDALLEAFKRWLCVTGAVCVCVRCPTGGLQEVVVCYRSSMCLYDALLEAS